MADGQETPTAIDRRRLAPAPGKVDLGQILLRDGVIRLEQLDECLRLQASLAAQGAGTVPRLGEIMVQKGYATATAVARALNEQDKTILFCPKCEVLLNVDTRADAVDYSCGRCQGKLVPPPPGGPNKSSESSVIVNSNLPIPPEVQALRDDPQRRFGKYVILEQIGRGGIAEVFRAWDIYLHQFVALKRIQAGEDSEDRQSRIASLLNEAHNAIRLRHPNIVSIYDIGRVGREYYISMEFLDGKTLFDAVCESRDRRRISPFHEDPGKWLEVLFQAAHAVHYAHTRPIPTFHCDLKPGNIFVTREDRVCVLDFGLARQLGEYDSELGVIVGTPSYMSPEQACGRTGEIDVRSDVYGLGAVLYELLCGRPPFVGSMGEVLRRTVNERPCPPSQVLRLKEGSGEAPRGLPPIPPALEALCLRCLEKRREMRPPTALAFAQEIERAVRGTASSVLPAVPVSPPTPPAGLSAPPAAPTPARALSRRTWAAAGGVALALLGGWILWPSSGGGPDSGVRALAEFRPDLVSRPGSDEIGRRTTAIAAFKLRLSGAVADKRPVLAELAAGGRMLKNVKLWKARAEALVLSVGDEPDAVPWVDLGVAGVLAVSRACGLASSPEDRFALGLFCLSASAPKEARELLESLRGTPLQADAESYLAGLGKS